MDMPAPFLLPELFSGAPAELCIQDRNAARDQVSGTSCMPESGIMWLRKIAPCFILSDTLMEPRHMQRNYKDHHF
jgi:hypothetical protein